MRRTDFWGAIGRIDRRVYLLGSAGLVRSVGRSATFVFLPLVFAEVYHLSYITIGVLIAAIVPISTLSFLAGGHLADRFGRRPFAAYPSFASAGLLALLWLNLGNGVPIVMALWALNSICGGLSRPAQTTMIGDVTPPDLTVTAYGVWRVFTNTGFAISPAVGGVLADTTGLASIFLFAAITSLVEATVLVLFLRETFVRRPSDGGEPAPGFTVPFRDRSFVWLLVALVGLAVVMNQFNTPLALFLGAVRGVPLTEFGLIYSLNGVLVVVLQIPISRIMERRRQHLSWMAAGTLAYGSSFLLFDAAGSFPGYLLAMGILTVGEDVVSPTQQSLVAGLSGPERRGSYFGAYNATTNAARVVGPVAGTLLLGLGAGGPTILWVTMFGLAVLVAGGFLYLRNVARRRTERLDPETLPVTSDVLLAGSE